MTKYGMGALRSPPDDRDFVAESFHPPASRVVLPPTLDLTPGLGVRSQGSRGTCSAFVGATIKTWQEQRDTGYEGPWSPEYIYTHRANRPSPGMWGRDVMKILAQHGCATEKSLPYKDGDLAGPDAVAEHVHVEARQFRTNVYAAVHTVAGLKEALVRDGPCYMSLPVYNHGVRMWVPEREGQAAIGSHALTVVGWTGEGFTLLNSWGAEWGDRGTCVMPWADFGYQWELWTCMDVAGSPLPEWLRRDSGDGGDRKDKRRKTAKLFGVIPLPCLPRSG